jgi:hypothetical protein
MPAKKRKAVKHSSKKKQVSPKVEKLLQQELKKEAKDFFPRGKGLGFWFKRYSPVIVTQGIALLTYFYLVFYLFYPEAILQGKYLYLLILLVFVFLLAGLFMYLGLRSEMIFVRILSFIFVFIIFTFLLLFVLIAHTMKLRAVI